MMFSFLTHKAREDYLTKMIEWAINEVLLRLNAVKLRQHCVLSGNVSSKNYCKIKMQRSQQKTLHLHIFAFVIILNGLLFFSNFLSKLQHKNIMLILKGSSFFVWVKRKRCTPNFTKIKVEEHVYNSRYV